MEESFLGFKKSLFSPKKPLTLNFPKRRWSLGSSVGQEPRIPITNLFPWFVLVLKTVKQPDGWSRYVILSNFCFILHLHPRVVEINETPSKSRRILTKCIAKQISVGKC